MSGDHPPNFVPAAGFRRLTALYDPVLSAIMRERSWKSWLVERVSPQPGQRILDLGSGTGTLTLMLQQACPGAEIIGVDADPDVIARARAKAVQTGVTPAFQRSRIDELDLVPAFGVASFDTIVSSLVFHHLNREAKRRALINVVTLLRPGGMMHVADWGQPDTTLMRLLFYPVQALDGFANTADNLKGLLPQFMREAGLQEVHEIRRVATAFGSLSFYEGVRP
ncbi:class I SAM-dependent methyltransferase [Microvirga sp. VF16]|uniref:class I SAM-dependent methyltransferase n=1 Tax=Microvirga sp. VF16 TaxID=2807101 RepID=UPI00193CF8A0|nr:class I SAM-dependent methyltransferase [Microvirga sp. VF16]QRM35263.1 class I SAM-dependent methyltransferase [Microvirga sp. VF16]